MSTHPLNPVSIVGCRVVCRGPVSPLRNMVDHRSRQDERDEPIAEGVIVADLGGARESAVVLVDVGGAVVARTLDECALILSGMPH